MQRIEVNVLTGEQTIVDLTPEEIAQAQASAAAWEAEQAAKQAEPSLSEVVAQLQSEIVALKAKNLQS